MGFMSLFAKVPTVHGAEARDLVREGAVLLDVRETSEWNAGHAPQAAHLPLGRIGEASKKVRVGKRVEDLGGCFDRFSVAQLAGAERLTHRLPLDILVGDVDVAAVAAEVVGANAAIVPEARCSFHFPRSA